MTKRFGATLQLIPDTLKRRVTSKSMKISDKFATAIHQTLLIPSLLHRIQQLSYIVKWTLNDSEELETIDAQFTQILLEAESKCAVPTENHWSIDLQNKYLT
jgi:hypothetical protein